MVMKSDNLSCDNGQVVLAYEQLKMTPEMIAEDMGYELSLVKQCLLSCSESYRALVLGLDGGKPDILLFSADDARNAAEAIKALACEAELETVKLRANQFIIDEFKGRNDMNALVTNAFNITALNDVLTNARKAMKMAEDKAKQLREGSIDLKVVTEVQHEKAA